MVTRNPLTIFPPVAGRFIGLDYGKARIGVAVSDSAGRLATAHGSLNDKTFAARLDTLAKLTVAQPFLGLIVGFPLNMDGSVGPTGQAAQSFADEVEKKLGLPVLLWDERLTSRQAENAYFEQNTAGRHGSKFSKKSSVGKIDANAAVVMLQSFLDYRQISLAAEKSPMLSEGSAAPHPLELK